MCRQDGAIERSVLEHQLLVLLYAVHGLGGALRRVCRPGLGCLCCVTVWRRIGDLAGRVSRVNRVIHHVSRF